jgi:predicted GIY-YIG superfamily endonuclease
MLHCRDGSIYTGITTHIEKRVRQHNAGSGAKYTRSRRPVVVIHQESLPDESAARKREAQIKRWTKKKKEAFLATVAAV